MNLTKVTDTLASEGITHHLIAPNVLHIHWLVDGSSQPVVEYDVKYNFTRLTARSRQLTGKDKGTLKSVLERLKRVNTH